MKTFFTLLLTASFFYGLHWFLMFQKDPYTYCEDHPNKEMSSDYYLCQPGDFDFPKGVLEKTLPVTLLGTKESDSRLQKKAKKKKAAEVIDSEDEALEQIDPSTLNITQ